MKKTLFIIGLCAVLLSMPTLLAFPTTQKHSLLFSPLKISDGTFTGGLGRGHWKNGFNIDTVYEYMNGVYTSGAYIKISGEITNPHNEKIGEISAFIIHKIIFGSTQNIQGQKAPIIVILMMHQNNQFVGRILVSMFRPAPHIWGYLIPNT
jgi:hypothetical protein